MNINSLLQRLEYLEACNAIHQLIGRYATAADQRNNPQIMHHLFHEDAIWQAAGFGAYQGRQSIVAGLSEIAREQILWSLHVMGVPNLEFSENQQQAKVQWVLWEVSTIAGSEASQNYCLGGFYQAKARKDSQGIWRFDEVLLNIALKYPIAANLYQDNSA